MDLIRIATAGSVDDGKSTLIGRLLYDSHAVLQDVLKTTQEVSRRQNNEYLNLALLTDGLRAEREQGITIDVAYRYFQTAHRKFILADTPGHVQYTRNMVTGASTADIALILVDARSGVVEQTRRHTVIAALLGIKNIVVCINKMDLVGYSEDVYSEIEVELSGFIQDLSCNPAQFIPISALHGDNVVDPSGNMHWYTGLPLLKYLEEIDVTIESPPSSLRLPVQYVVRPQTSEHRDYRAYAGTVLSGTVSVGQQVVIQPSGHRTCISSIGTPSGAVASAGTNEAVSVRLSDDLDISRGDLISSVVAPATEVRSFAAIVCWMGSSSALKPGYTYRMKQASRTVTVQVSEISYALDVSSLITDNSAESLELNDIGRVELKTQAPLTCDNYSDNRKTGSFILIDESSHETVAAGMIGELPFVPDKVRELAFGS